MPGSAQDLLSAAVGAPLASSAASYTVRADRHEPGATPLLLSSEAPTRGLKRGNTGGSLGSASNASGPSGTGSQASAASVPEMLRARNHPRLSRCQTALSSLSEKTGDTAKSSVPAEV